MPTGGRANGGGLRSAQPSLRGFVMLEFVDPMGATGGQEVRIGVQTIQPRRTKMELDRTDAPVAGEYATVYAAFELSKAKWKLGIVLPGSEKMSRYTIVGG